MFAYRRLAVVLAAFAALAIAAAPAGASLTAAGGSMSGSAADTTWDGGVIRCPTADLTATVAGSQISARFLFTVTGTCIYTGAWTLASVTCRGPITFTATSSVAGVRAAGTVSLDLGSSCTFYLAVYGCTSVATGPQGPFIGWTFDQASQRLTITFTGLRATGGCGIGRGLNATFAVSSRLTIS